LTRCKPSFASSSVDDDVAAAAGGDGDVAGHVAELERAVGAQLQRLGLARRLLGAEVAVAGTCLSGTAATLFEAALHRVADGLLDQPGDARVGGDADGVAEAAIDLARHVADDLIGDVDADPDADVVAALRSHRGGGKRNGDRRESCADRRESCRCRHDDLRPVARAAPI
jgi:hypothetical protein